MEFEGEFLFDRKWNGKGYDQKGNITYELINGKGYAKEYSSDNFHLIYEGEYLDGNRNGYGKEYQYIHLIYEGEFKNGKRNGKGKEYHYFGIIMSTKDLIEAKGWNKFENIYCLNYNSKFNKEKCYLVENMEKINENLVFIKKFEGEYIDGEKNGKGKEYNKYGKLIFEGEYLNGKKLNGKIKKYY